MSYCNTNRMLKTRKRNHQIRRNSRRRKQQTCAKNRQRHHKNHPNTSV